MIGCKKNFKHGHYMNRKPTIYYSVWQHMMSRCENKNNTNYHRYGGRGIKVCEQFRDPITFINYLKNELGDRPKDYSIDRIDNSKGYEPGNLQWATAKQQRANQG